MSYKILKSSENKRLKSELKEIYGFKVPSDWLFYTISDNRVWLLSKKIVDFVKFHDNLGVETMGLYFCYFDYQRLRLSPEAAQLIGPECSKNIFMLSIEQAQELIRGFDIDIETNLDTEYIILNTPKGIIGVGKNHKTKILCQFRKNRRIRKL